MQVNLLPKAMPRFQFVFRLDGSPREAVLHESADETSARDSALTALRLKLLSGGGIGSVSIGQVPNDDVRLVRWLGSWELNIVAEATWTAYAAEERSPA